MTISIDEASRLSGLFDGGKTPDDSIEVVKRYDSRAEIEKVLRNRDPYLLVDRAVVFLQSTAGEIRRRIVSQLSVTEKHCAGHYPGYPMLPFAMMGEVIGQTGATLIISLFRDMVGSDVPLVVRASSLKIGNSGPVRPGDVIMAVAEILSGKGLSTSLTAVMTTNGKIVLTLEDLGYLAVPIPIAET